MNIKISIHQVYTHIVQYPGISVSLLAGQLGVSTRTINRHIQMLMSQGMIAKKGTPPLVQYYPSVQDHQISDSFDNTSRRLLEQERFQISKTGQELRGGSGFMSRCTERKQDPKTAVERRKKHIAYLDSITTSLGICATHKLADYPENPLLDLRYGHIYALPEFGKTPYGTWMELAKTYPSVNIFDTLLQSIIPYVRALIAHYQIDALCFAQPTAKRKLQIMDYLSKTLFNTLPRIRIQKTPGYFPAQKTLKQRDDRIANAQASFEIFPSQTSYKHVLIIDDAVGSGATLAEIGNKIIKQKLAETVVGFSVVGTANGIFDEMKNFEVMSSV